MESKTLISVLSLFMALFLTPVVVMVIIGTFHYSGTIGGMIALWAGSLTSFIYLEIIAKKGKK